jgi:hypothetical protein
MAVLAPGILALAASQGVQPLFQRHSAEQAQREQLGHRLLAMLAAGFALIRGMAFGRSGEWLCGLLGSGDIPSCGVYARYRRTVWRVVAHGCGCSAVAGVGRRKPKAIALKASGFRGGYPDGTLKKKGATLPDSPFPFR